MSAISFLSDGLKELASKGANLLSLARGLSQRADGSATCVSYSSTTQSNYIGSPPSSLLLYLILLFIIRSSRAMLGGTGGELLHHSIVKEDKHDGQFLESLQILILLGFPGTEFIG